MNILYLSADRGIPVRGHKGASVHVRMLSNAFAAAGNHVTIVTPRPGPDDGPAPQATLLTAPLLTHHDQPMGVFVEQCSNSLYEFCLAKLNHQPYDAIYERYSLWSDVGARLSEATGLPLLLEVNAPLRLEAALYREVADETLAAAVEQRQFRAATHLLAVSSWLADYAAEQGVARERIHVLPNGVDPQQFHPAVRGGDVHHRHDLGDKIVVGFVGRPRPWHDLETLLTAVSYLRQTDNRYHLLLVGQMPDDIEQQLAEHGLSDAVTVTGPVPHRDVPAHIAAMDIAVSPHRSLEHFYYSPLKLFEYLACGVATVAANAGQQGAIIRPGDTGYLYPPGNSRVLAAYIRKLANEPELRRDMGWRGAEYVLQAHTWKQNAAAVVNLLAPSPTPTTAPQLPIFDNKLRTRLYRATRPDLAAACLADELPDLRVETVSQIEVFKYKPRRRAVLGYRLNGRSSQTNRPIEQEIIGKVFRDERGQRLFALQDALWRNGFGPRATDNIHVPRVLAYIPKMRMLVQEKAAGRTLNELVDTTHLNPFMPASAEGLAKLHNSQLPTLLAKQGSFTLKPYTLADELVVLRPYEATVVAERPFTRALMSQLRQQLEQWAGALAEPETAVAVHRDFYYSQLLFDGLRLTLIDFDLLALGDPAIDVANFVAHLHFMGLDHLGDFDALADDAELFKESYSWHVPVNEAFWERAAFYEAATYFRLLNVIAPRPGLAHLFDEMLMRTETAVANGLLLLV
ncbi:MAG: glycosyltransferase [Anaerolineales bacterium]|nr:glycosyltransferase [Anaerolineales bacterium]